MAQVTGYMCFTLHYVSMRPDSVVIRALRLQFDLQLSGSSLKQIVHTQYHVPLPVSVAQRANALSELQCATGPDWLKTYGGQGSIPGRGVGLSVSWTNSGHAMRLISCTGTEGLPVSSKN